MKPKSRVLFLMAALALLAGCSTQPEPSSQSVPAKAEHAPDIFRVKFETSKGDFLVPVTKEWAPVGADRFFELVQSGFFNGARFFRVRPTFMVQFGINGDPKISTLWANSNLPDDPVK